MGRERMKRSRFAERSWRSWRKRFRGMEVNEVRDYRRLRQENTRFRKMLADRDLEIEVMKEVI